MAGDVNAGACLSGLKDPCWMPLARGKPPGYGRWWGLAKARLRGGIDDGGARCARCDMTTYPSEETKTSKANLARVLKHFSQLSMLTAASMQQQGDIESADGLTSIAQLAEAIEARLMVTDSKYHYARELQTFQGEVGAIETEFIGLNAPQDAQARINSIQNARKRLTLRMPYELLLTGPSTEELLHTLQSHEEKVLWLTSSLDGLVSRVAALRAEHDAALAQAQGLHSVLTSQANSEQEGRNQAFASSQQRHQKQVDEDIATYSARVDARVQLLADRFQGTADGMLADMERTRAEHAAALAATMAENDRSLDRAVNEAAGVKTKVEAVLVQINANFEQSNTLISNTAANEVSKEYRSAEKAERAAAWWWQLSTILGSVAFIAVGVGTVVTAKDPTAIYFALRAVVASACAGFIAYMGSQVKGHRDEARRLRQIALGIHALGPYIAEFPPEERTATKRGLAERIFVPGESAGRAEIAGAMELASKSLDIVKSVAETAKNVSDPKNTKPV